MFWKKKKEETATPTVAKAEKLPEPQKIPEMVGRYLIDNLKMDIVWVLDLKAVIRQRAGGKPGFDIRVYDALEMSEKKVQVKDYTSLDGRPDLILYEGWFDRQTKQLAALPRVMPISGPVHRYLRRLQHRGRIPALSNKP
jgi:hypothetical protein